MKICQEPIAFAARTKTSIRCGLPSMARWDDRWVCFGCLNNLELIVAKQKAEAERQAKKGQPK